MPPIQLVLLLSLGSFQATIPAIGPEPSPVFEDSAAGLASFTQWARTTMGEPRFNQPPHQLCVVAALPFAPNKGPYVALPISQSKPPVRALEPYSASFHYVELPAGAPPPKPRTLQEAVSLCRRVYRP